MGKKRRADVDNDTGDMEMSAADDAVAADVSVAGQYVDDDDDDGGGSTPTTKKKKKPSKKERKAAALEERRLARKEKRMKKLAKKKKKKGKKAGGGGGGGGGGDGGGGGGGGGDDGDDMDLDVQIPSTMATDDGTPKDKPQYRLKKWHVNFLTLLSILCFALLIYLFITDPLAFRSTEEANYYCYDKRQNTFTEHGNTDEWTAVCNSDFNYAAYPEGVKTCWVTTREPLPAGSGLEGHTYMSYSTDLGWIDTMSTLNLISLIIDLSGYVLLIFLYSMAQFEKLFKHYPWMRFLCFPAFIGLKINHMVLSVFTCTRHGRKQRRRVEYFVLTLVILLLALYVLGVRQASYDSAHISTEIYKEMKVFNLDQGTNIKDCITDGDAVGDYGCHKQIHSLRVFDSSEGTDIDVAALSEETEEQGDYLYHTYELDLDSTVAIEVTTDHCEEEANSWENIRGPGLLQDMILEGLALVFAVAALILRKRIDKREMRDAGVEDIDELPDEHYHDMGFHFADEHAPGYGDTSAKVPGMMAMHGAITAEDIADMEAYGGGSSSDIEIVGDTASEDDEDDVNYLGGSDIDDDAGESDSLSADSAAAPAENAVSVGSSAGSTTGGGDGEREEAPTVGTSGSVVAVDNDDTAAAAAAADDDASSDADSIGV